MTIHLTMALARSLPGPDSGKDDKLHFDDYVRGLALRVRKSGGRSWLLQYRTSGRPQRITLGGYRRHRYCEGANSGA